MYFDRAVIYTSFLEALSVDSLDLTSIRDLGAGLECRRARWCLDIDTLPHQFIALFVYSAIELGDFDICIIVG